MKNKEDLMKFWISIIFNEYFLNSQYEYANEWVDDVIASQFSIYFVHRNDENPIFQLWESKTSFISTLNKMQNNVCSDIIWYGICFYMFE